MKRLVLLLASFALASAGAAEAKGPSSARIEGPGLDKPIRLSGDAESNNATASPFYRFVQDVGFFPAVFCCQQPNPMLPTAPKGALGPKYTIVYTVPGPESKLYRVTQRLYPYASGGPLVHTASGQRIFGTMRTSGGWFRAEPTLNSRLVSLGLPAKEPGSSGLSGGAWAGIGVGGLFALSLGAFLTRRRTR
jgi:hypothetical protein